MTVASTEHPTVDAYLRALTEPGPLPRGVILRSHGPHATEVRWHAGGPEVRSTFTRHLVLRNDAGRVTVAFVPDPGPAPDPTVPTSAPLLVLEHPFR